MSETEASYRRRMKQGTERTDVASRWLAATRFIAMALGTHIHRVLRCVAVGGLRPKRPKRSEADHIATVFSNKCAVRLTCVAKPPEFLFERLRLNIERSSRVEDEVVVDVEDGWHVCFCSRPYDDLIGHGVNSLTP